MNERAVENFSYGIFVLVSGFGWFENVVEVAESGKRFSFVDSGLGLNIYFFF